MLFIPSIGGRSHDIVEDTAEADIVLGCEVLAGTVARLAERGEDACSTS
jgi:N-carbamoyl-L-amino-acid hydrolase